MTTLIATDLDRTMIYSSAAAGRPVTDAVCVETYDGGPLSYMTSRAATMLAELAQSAAVVPTTTRTMEQFRRIALPGGPYRYAVTSNGGNLLVDGVADPAWRASVGRAIADSAAPLADVLAEQHRRAGDFVLKERTADDLFCYLVVEPGLQPPEFFDDWSQWCHERGWGVSQQGRKIYAIPNALCKSNAVAEVRQRLELGGVEVDRVLAAGDGALDADMLAAADHGIRPRHGELELMQWSHETVTVTPSSGIVAGEEILEWFSSRR